MAARIAVAAIVEAIDDDDNSDEEDDTMFFNILAEHKSLFRREKVPSVNNFWEETVPLFSENDFQRHLRLSKCTFDRMLLEINISKTNRSFGKTPIHPEKRAMICIWYLCNTTSMREMAVLFDVSKSTIYDCVHGVCDALCAIRQRVIAWPDIQRQQESSDHFENESRIPGIVGAIDGTHITLTNIPKGDQDYVNRKGYPSIQLQLIVDHMLLITDSLVGWPGSTHDARVFRRSPIYDQLENGILGPNSFIIGDSAYPLKKFLITPFRDNGHLNQSQRNFNTKLSTSRQHVERAIGLLKCRFRRLTALPCVDVECTCHMIMACCVLHNLCVLSNDSVDEIFSEDQQNNINWKQQCPASWKC